MTKAIIIGAISALVLAGCASAPKLSADQCTAMNWHELGKKDGLAGQSMTALNDEIMLCKEHGISVDLDTYKQGRAEGLKTYCAPPALLEATLQNVGDPYSCEPFTQSMRKTVDKGVETRNAVLRYQNLKQQFDKLTQQKQQINQEGSRLQQQYNQTKDEATRQQIAQRLNTLQQQLQQVDAELVKANPIMQTEEQKYQSAVQSYETYKAGLAQ